MRDEGSRKMDGGKIVRDEWGGMRVRDERRGFRYEKQGVRSKKCG